MSEEEIEEELKINPIAWACFTFIIGILVGSLTMDFYYGHQVYKSPDEIATYLEEMLFNHSHLDEIQQPQLRALIKTDTTTVAEFKRWYRIYNRAGMSHQLLKAQVNIICYDTKWKDES